MKLVKLGFAALLASLALALPPREARAVTVERVVAVVGDRPILLSELRHRAIPSRIRILGTSRDPNIQAAAEKELYGQLIERMIDDRLEEQAAEKARLSVSPDEVDRGISNVAANAKLGVHDVLNEVKRQGLTEQDFRDEIRRQIVEGKLIELRVRPRVRVTESDARVAYTHWQQEVKQQGLVEVRSLVLSVSDATLETKGKLIEELARRARAGEDYCQIIASYSEDLSTKDSCGTHGPESRRRLPPELGDAITRMKPGEIGGPMRVRGPTGDYLVVFQLMNEPRMLAYEEVKAEMSQRAILEALEHQRKLWLQELRRGVYVDVRW